MSGGGKSKDIESIWVTALAWEREMRGVKVGLANGYGIFCWVNKDILKLIVAVVTQLCPHSKNHWVVHLIFFKILFLSDVCTQHGVQTYNPEVKGRFLY